MGHEQNSAKTFYFFLNFGHDLHLIFVHCLEPEKGSQGCTRKFGTFANKELNNVLRDTSKITRQAKTEINRL